MTIATYIIPDAFLIWLWKQFIRIGAACVALGIITFLLSLVFRAVAAMIEALHEVLHQVLLFCTSVNSTYAHAGLFGQAIICLISLSVLGAVLYRIIGYLYRSWRTSHENC